MAEIYQTQSVHELIPEFHSAIFSGHEDARFAVGKIAEGRRVLHPVEDVAYHQLRANVYSEEGFIPPDAIDGNNGGEYDTEDARSIHMAVIENRGDTQRLIASMRLIKRDNNGPLPIEQLYPHVFVHGPAPSTSCEVSRYIVRHEERKAQDMASWALFQQGLTIAMINNSSTAYAVVSPALSRIFLRKRLPVTELSDPVWIEQYGECNVPIAIDVAGLAERLEDRDPGALKEMLENQNNFSYFGERKPEVKMIILGSTILGMSAAGEQS